MSAFFNGMTGFNPVVKMFKFQCPLCARIFTAAATDLPDAIDKLQQSHIHFDGNFFYCSDCLDRIFQKASLKKGEPNCVGRIHLIEDPLMISDFDTADIE